uniref:Retrotransposon gag domain-containing protein n=1 Tax=Tanacetum cinerariifolium TaxID=118510 RepID=A0A6L2JA76_TANCI|nr:hypothetical protein [Tanacetum cinerariifolium]
MQGTKIFNTKGSGILGVVITSLVGDDVELCLGEEEDKGMSVKNWRRVTGNGYDKNETKSEQNRTKSRANAKRGKVQNQARQSQNQKGIKPRWKNEPGKLGAAPDSLRELLRAPTEGYAEAIVVPSILAEQSELKHSLINMMTSDLKRTNRMITSVGAARRTTNLRNEISNFQQQFDESFHEAWDRYKDLLRACPHYDFTELHQLDTFYNALYPADQDFLNAATGGNLLERRTQDVLTIIENKSKVRNSRSKSVVSQVKSCDVNSNSSSEIAKFTYAVNQQTSAMTTAMTAMLKQFQATLPPAFVKAIKETCVTCGGAHPYYQCLAADGNTFPELKDNIQGYVSAAVVNYNQGNLGYRPPEETFTDPDFAKYTIKVPHPPVQKYKPLSQREYVLHQRDPLHPNIPYPSRMLKQKQQEKDEVQIQIFWQMFKQLHINITLVDALILMPKYQKMLKALLSNKEKLQELANTPLNENCSAVILKKLPEKFGDPGKFLIPCGFSKLKCKALADLVGKFTFPADFVIVDYESDPRVPLILGRPFLRTGRALIDVHSEEMILRDGDERLILNIRHDTSSYSNQPQRESINLINVFNNSKGGNILPEKLLDLDFTKDLHPPLHDDPLSGSTTCSFSSNPLLEEFIDKLALITFPLKYDDDLQFDFDTLANPADNFVDSIPEMFTDEHALNYSSPPILDEYDDFLEIESYAENVYDDPFDSKGEKIKESKILIDELDLPWDFLPLSEYDSFIS